MDKQQHMRQQQTNKQTEATHVQGAVWNCVVTESGMQCVRVCGKASEMYQRYIGKVQRLITQGHTLTQA